MHHDCADEAAIRRHASAMGAGASVPLFAGMLTQRPWDQVRRAHGAPERLRVEGSEAERELIRGFAVQYASEIAHLLRCMPRPLLLLLKTNDCLRCVQRVGWCSWKGVRVRGPSDGCLGGRCDWETLCGSSPLPKSCLS